MRGVGYVAGGSLDEIQSQWAEFIEADVDVILFDREILSPEFNLSSPEQSNPEKESIWKYMETMEAAQTMSGNYARYETLDDLVPGDTIVLSSIKNLFFATKGICMNWTGPKAMQKGKVLDAYGPIGTRYWRLSEIPTTAKLPGS